MLQTFIGLFFLFVFTIVAYNIGASHEEGEQHQTLKKYKSPTGVIK